MVVVVRTRVVQIADNPVLERLLGRLTNPEAEKKRSEAKMKRSKPE